MPAEFNDNWAYGVDPTRREKYSLRQSRYKHQASVINRLAGEAQHAGRRLKLLDIGCLEGLSMRYLAAEQHADQVDFHGTDLALRMHVLYQPKAWKTLLQGDLMQGYPELPSGTFDVVLCEQVLEHLPELPLAMQTLDRLLKPGGTLICGVPTFPHGVHALRDPIVNTLDRLRPPRKPRGHVQSFSRISFLKKLMQHTRLEVQDVRGFRIVSGGLTRPLENLKWYWQLNCAIGKAVPGLCTEIQVVARKPLDAISEPAVRRAA